MGRQNYYFADKIKSKDIITSQSKYYHVWLAGSVVSDSLQPHGLQAAMRMEFSRQEYWSGLPFPSPGDLPHPGTEPEFLGRWILYH